jgi:plastocyanin
MNKIIPSVIEDNGEYYIHIEEYKKVKELGEHYKHLYSEVKKRNDNAIEYIKNKREQLHHSFDEPSWDYLFICNPDDLLRMLGEIDVED